MSKMTVGDINVTGKRVLVRVDFNVPIDEKTGAITDDSRIRAALPTIKHLIEHHARVILISHLGRPGGKIVDALRLAPIARCLAQILGQTVAIAPDCIGPEAARSVEALRDGGVLLLENVRFHADEEQGDVDFAQSLARLGDIFVNDAFGTAHRAHASVVGIARYLPSVAGLLLEKEINTLGSLLENPVHPFTAMFGGAKVSDKVNLLKNIMGKVDCLLIGGGMAATFLRARHYETGQSLIEADSVGTAARLIEAAASGVRLLLPVDVVITDEISAGARGEIVAIDSVPADRKIVDIGPRTIEDFSRELHGSQTVFWNGPLGIAEIPQFAEGTKTLARLLAGLEATTIIGGGSTAEVLNDMGLADKVTFVSTGGGATLEFLGGGELPGVAILRDKGS